MRDRERCQHNRGPGVAMQVRKDLRRLVADWFIGWIEDQAVARMRCE
jgi:hypothetical protein